MPDYTIQEIAAAIEATIVGNLPNQTRIKHLLTDSRQVTDGNHTLFFALKTGRNDGHRYISRLIADGVRTFVVSQIDMPYQSDETLVFLLSDNPLMALQKLAAYHRNKFTVPVIGITGSNGKTIVKEWLMQLLSVNEVVAGSPKSFNSQIGVPLSVWQLNEGHTIGVFEAGISQPGEMVNLEKIIRPTIGLITNIGQAHAANFKDKTQKIKEKLSLFSRAKILVCCSDHNDIMDCIKTNIVLQKIKLFTWGHSPDADLNIANIEIKGSYTQIEYSLKEELTKGGRHIHRFKIPFADEASIENSLHCMAVLKVLGYNNELIDQTFIHLPAIEMRLQLREGINNCSLINDSYSNDLNSLTIALEFLNQQKQHERKSIILSDILQSDREEALLYADISRLLKARDIRRLIGIGTAIGRYRSLFEGQCDYFNSTDDFLQWISSGSFADETILIKGARSFGFERIVTRLEQKNHETLLETNLSAIVHNLNYFRSLLKPGVKITAMVKAFSYGSGSFEIANALQFHRIDYLAVAYADEGFELRKAGITTPIMVMNPERINAGSLIRYQLEPEIYSIQQL
ncbi:MAG: bifunctional UDP-N-acetylmuramoyl-tripeptide:D-alanyl-D-alanine ligase/alanine racemase, partial [Bacteroidetes bacterium HGW-Bacteroidetes-22]